MIQETVISVFICKTTGEYFKIPVTQSKNKFKI